MSINLSSLYLLTSTAGEQWNFWQVCALLLCCGTILAIVLLPTVLALGRLRRIEATNQRLENTLTEQIAIEEELEKSQKVFTGAFNNSPVGIALISPTGKFLKVNRAITQITGYSKDELSSTDFQSITHPDDLKLCLGYVNQLITGISRCYKYEKRCFHKLGHIIPMLVSVSILRDAEGNPLFLIAHMQDISEQKRITAALQATTEASESANLAKGEFLAMMSHEIRTPMNAMLGMTELLADTTLSDHQRELIDVISASGKTLLTIINDILDFSKIESNKMDLESGPLNLYECVEEVLALFSAQADAKSLSLTSLVEPDNIPNCFKGDAVRLRQVLSNLVSNSLKFTEAGEVSIHVQVSPALERFDAPMTARYYHEVSFYIQDTGIGIAEDKLSQLFEPFDQVDASITRRYGGTGLGLSISKRLIEMMGGELWVNSTVGKGSTFGFKIKLEAYGKVRQSCFSSGHDKLKQKQLLIVDSNKTSRRYLSLQATSWHLKVIAVSSASAALKILSEGNAFDGIVVSEPLLDVDGKTLAAHIREFEGYRETPLIRLQKRKKSDCKTIEAQDDKTRLLKKPVRRSRFYNALVELLLREIPLSISTADVAAEEKYGIEPVTEDFSLSNPLRILLTEDITLNQKVALSMLAAYGYKADVANNGKEAIAALKNNSYDLVFMDVQMPEIDGLEATRRIRADASIQQPYIVAMTAHAMQGDREDCISAGMNDYVQKPICKKGISAVLKNCRPLESTPSHSLAVESTLEKSSTAIQAQSNQLALTTLDTEILETISQDKTFLVEVCKSFLKDAPVRISAIQFALQEENAPALTESAHALRSLSGCVGAMCLLELCRSLEALGRQNCIEPGWPLLTQVDTEFQNVQMAIHNYQNI